MGMPIDVVTQEQAVERVLDGLAGEQGGWVVTPNLDHVRRFVHVPEHRGFYEQATLVLADGMPLIWASRIAGRGLPERVAGSTLTDTLAGPVAKHGYSIFLLGGEEGAAEGAAEHLTKTHGVTIAGLYCPPLGFEDQPAQWDMMREMLKASGADLVYVALGSPKQEHVIERLRDTLPQAWWLGVGVSLSFLSGDKERAPGWMQKLGLEWIHRVAQEPKRLGRRYFIEGIPFAVRMMGWAVRMRLSGGGREAG